MNLNDLAAVAEIVGALGVILTLVFLAIELRKNTLATRQQSYHTIVSRRSSVFDEISDTREMTEIWIAGLVGADLDGVDSTRFTLQMINLMSHYQDIYLQNKAGIVETSIWEAERKILGANLYQPGFNQWWAEASQYFMADFVKAVSEITPVHMVEFNREKLDWHRPGGAFLRDEPAQPNVQGGRNDA